MSSNSNQSNTPSNARMRISISDSNSHKYYRAYIGLNANPYRAYVTLGGGSVATDSAVLGRSLLCNMILGNGGE